MQTSLLETGHNDICLVTRASSWPTRFALKRGFGATSLAPSQSCHAFPIHRLEPLTHRAFADAQGLGDVNLFPAFLLQFPGL